MDTPEVCTTTISPEPTDPLPSPFPGATAAPSSGPLTNNLPQLGTELPFLLALTGLALVVLALVALRTGKRAPSAAALIAQGSGESSVANTRMSCGTRSRSATKLFMVTAFGALVTALCVLLPAGDAGAETEDDTEYSEGCRLFELTPFTALGDANRIMPGGDTLLMRLAVTNQFASPITVAASLEPALATPWPAEISPLMSVIAAPSNTPQNLTPTDVVTLSPEDTMILELTARALPALGNEAQGLELEYAVRVTAEEVENA